MIIFLQLDQNISQVSLLRLKGQASCNGMVEAILQPKFADLEDKEFKILSDNGQKCYFHCRPLSSFVKLLSVHCIVKLALNSLTEYCANFICPLMLLPSLPRPDAGKKCFGNWD